MPVTGMPVEDQANELSPITAAAAVTVIAGPGLSGQAIMIRLDSEQLSFHGRIMILG